MMSNAHSRSFLRIGGTDCIRFLQGLLTQDIAKLNDNKIQFAALLSPQGKILHDMFLIAGDNEVIIDSAARYQETLLKRLMLYRLRADVSIEACAAPGVALPDPRHPQLPPRDYRSGAPEPTSLALGIPEMGLDFEPDTVVPLDAGYDLLHAISFTKGCYVGQEVTARMHYKNIARRGFYILEKDGEPVRLALLRFEDMQKANDMVTVDNVTYHARLPEWMEPKLAQFRNTPANQ